MIRQQHPISIHAPRTGSDFRALVDDASVIQFQSTLPARGATSFVLPLSVPAAISIHAPRTGSDDVHKAFRVCGICISIHAPRTGSDRRAIVQRGVHHISIHAPRTGSDRILSGRDALLDLISIHAPRTGSDGRCLSRWRRAVLFQSTLPARGATQRPGVLLNQRVISIHAPRTGSDQIAGTHTRRFPHFNPRSPHGERQRKVTILSIRIIGFAQKVYHKTVLLRISLAENAVILPKRPQNPVRTSLQKAGGLRFARAIRAARPYSISSPSGA